MRGAESSVYGLEKDRIVKMGEKREKQNRSYLTKIEIIKERVG